MEGEEPQLNKDALHQQKLEESMRAHEQLVVKRLQDMALHMLEKGRREHALKLLASAGRMIIKRETGIDLGDDPKKNIKH